MTVVVVVVVLFFGSRSKTSNLRNADSDKVGVSQFWCLVGKDPGFESTPWSILIATKQAEATKFLVFFLKQGYDSGFNVMVETIRPWFSRFWVRIL